MPFHMALDSAAIDLHFDVPSSLSKMLHEGKLDIALTSSVTAMDENFSFLPHFGIAAFQEILSVNLYVKQGLKTLNEASIALTSQSLTSIALLKVLCSFWNVFPHFVTYHNDPDAFLLIGDDALQDLNPKGFKRIDLAQSWYEATSLPFVFALYAYKKGSFGDLEKALDRSLEWYETHEELFLNKVSEKTVLGKELLKRYYSLCCYRLTEKEHEGLKLFRKYYVQQK